MLVLVFFVVFNLCFVVAVVCCFSCCRRVCFDEEVLFAAPEYLYLPARNRLVPCLVLVELETMLGVRAGHRRRTMSKLKTSLLKPLALLGSGDCLRLHLQGLAVVADGLLWHL